MELEVPAILNIPEKLWPLLTDLSKYNYIIIEGGRGSAKTQSVARVLLYVGEKRKVRIVCGREIQDTIDESVFTVLTDLIKDYKLAYDPKKVGIKHYISKSEFKFKGFREEGAVNIKGMEGADIVWVDEAQTVTKPTLDILIPTVRKNRSKLIFTMNRYMRNDAVIEELAGRPDCLHIIINYIDNPHCSLKIKNEAEILKNRNPKEYEHIYLGKPLSQSDDYLFNFDKLQASFNINPIGELFIKQRVMGIDFAAQGNDQCVVSILDRVTNQHWKLSEQIKWDEPDTMISVGKIVDFIGRFKPDLTVLDVGGLGKPVYDRIVELKIPNFFPYNGAWTKNLKDPASFVNRRAESYFDLRDWFDQGWLIIDKKNTDLIKQLEKIKFKYRSNGKKLIEEKLVMKKEIGCSPDESDSLKMAVYGAIHHLGRYQANSSAEVPKPTRVYASKRKR